MIDEVSSLREVVGRFREFSRPVELQRKPFDADALAPGHRGACSATCGSTSTARSDLPQAWGDADRLRQILMNLASNSREAGAERLGLSARPAEGGVALVFEDDGPGILPEERERIFEPYRTGRKTGLGLGLALVKGIVLAHEGSIEVDEGRWGGARFTIVLPAATEEKA